MSPALAGGFLTTVSPGKPIDSLFNWIVCVLMVEFLYILDNSPLSDASFANIFSQSVTYLLIILTLSFAE